MWHRLTRWVAVFWRTIRRPSRHFSLGFLTVGGFVWGVLFWGGFNTALEATNTEEFCVSCHSMEANVYQDVQRSIHYVNRTGVRAECADCHVPHTWTDKIVRKVKASREVWATIFGSIDTRREFEQARLELAKSEWARQKADDSQQCRHCHHADAMDLVAQNTRAQRLHDEYLFTGKATCIDCHKGIAHELPDMTGIEPGWVVPAHMRAHAID